MTGAADGVEKACLLAFGDRAEIEEDSPAPNAGNHRRVANSQARAHAPSESGAVGNGGPTLTATVGMGCTGTLPPR